MSECSLARSCQFNSRFDARHPLDHPGRWESARSDLLENGVKSISSWESYLEEAS